MTKTNEGTSKNLRWGNEDTAAEIEEDIENFIRACTTGASATTQKIFDKAVIFLEKYGKEPSTFITLCEIVNSGDTNQLVLKTSPI